MNTTTEAAAAEAAAAEAAAKKEVIEFQSLAIVTGKGVTAIDRIRAREAIGLPVAVQASLNIDRKQSLEALRGDALYSAARALAGGHAGKACTIVGLAGKSKECLMLVNKEVPFTEFLRLVATLEAKPQTTAKGHPTPASKALALASIIRRVSDGIRQARDAERKRLAQ